MTTYFDFAPSLVAAPQFQPTLDGQQYTCVVTWNVYAQRFYVNCFALDGTLVFSLPMIGSATGVDIQSIAWSLGGSVTVVTATPHGYPVGSTVDLTISGCSPNGYNGKMRCFAIDPATLVYQLTTNPGSVTALGTVSYDISLSAGYFDSTLVFRQENSQFEVSP